jgi:hypothetical protein
MRLLVVLTVACLAVMPIRLHAEEPPPSTSSAGVQATAEIPKGYETGDDTISPDWRFAILYPLQETYDEKNDKYLPNLLVRLKPYAVLATVEKDGLPRNVTTSLNAQWNGNLEVAIWEYRRWGIVDLNVYQIENDKVKRVEAVWGEARQIFQRDFKRRFLKKYPKENDSFIIVSEHGQQEGRGDFQFKGRQLILDLSADNKPNLAPGPHWTAQLHAIWNLDTAKFDQVDFRPGKIDINPEP